MERHYFFKLAEKHAKGECTKQELDLLNAYYDTLASQQKASLNDEQINQLEKLMWARIQHQMHHTPERPAPDRSPKTVRWPRSRMVYPAAAAVVAVFFAFYFFADWSPDTGNPPRMEAAITPGSDRATLITANGNMVMLDGERGGITNTERGVKYVDGASIAQLGTNTETSGLRHASEGMEGMHTVITPRGGQYVVVLPDSSKVWLNAESSLKYPPRFNGKERRVFLTGEAYFEVAHAQQSSTLVPFKVVTANEVVEVLGTDFNINAYADEAASTVALVAGKVKVSLPGRRSTIIHPGQQTLVSGNHMRVEDVDVNECLAWKNGKFMFNNERLESVMRKLARWYDIQVDVPPGLTNISIWGSVSRYDDFDEVLRIIKMTDENIQFEVKGRRVTFMK